MAVYVEFGTVCRSLLFLIRCVIAVVTIFYSYLFLQGLPRNGGEKNYLEFLYRKPELLSTCCIAMYACLLVRRISTSVLPPHLLNIRLYQGWSAANGVVIGECVAFRCFICYAF